MKKLLLLSACIFIASCNSKSDANENNFSDVIGSYLDRNPVCLNVGRSVYGEMPVTYTTWFSERQELTKEAFLNSHDQLAALAKLGFVDFSLKKIKKDAMNNTEVNITLTPEGKKHYRTLEGKAMGGGTTKTPVFCYAKNTLLSVNNFSAPSNALGQTVSSVIYTYKVTDFQDWADSEIVTNAYPEVKGFKKILNQEKEKKVDLVLTNNGWVHFREF